jgi:mono/diheme cytochrome c family protein
MSAWLRATLSAGVLLLLAGWWFSRPLPLDAGILPDHQADTGNGKRLFQAGGCAACHGEQGKDGQSQTRLSGGLELPSPYGVFVAPNISPDSATGIGSWSQLDFVNAMKRGVTPGGRHLYPAFPYTSYTRMTLPDLLDLKAYLDTLPAVSNVPGKHRLNFPFGFRRALGLWKRLFLSAEPIKPVDASNEQLLRGRYLVEGPGHCGECHTPRNIFGALQTDAWLTGAPSPDGEGHVPDISPKALADWSESDLSYFLGSGLDPDFDVVGGSMVEVQENLARLPQEDRDAIAAYLKAAGQP